MSDDNIPQLDNTARDVAVSACRTALKVATSILPIPVFGPLLGEVIGNIIPDLRALRLEQYVRLLGERLSEVEEQAVRDKLKDPSTSTFLKKGMAVRTFDLGRSSCIYSITSGTRHFRRRAGPYRI